MDQIIWNFSSYARVKYILHTTDTNFLAFDTAPELQKKSKENCIFLLYAVQNDQLKLI